MQEQAQHKYEPCQSRMPHIYIILFALILIAYLCAVIVPSGRYQRQALPDGREVVIANTYKKLATTAPSPMTILEAIPDGLVDAASIVILTLLVGGSILVLQKQGIINLAIECLIGKFDRKTYLLIPILIWVFGIISAFIGIPELGIAYFPMIEPFLKRLGYQSIDAAAVAIIPCTLGFAFGITPPANVGVSHMLTGLPMFSGSLFRLVFLIIIMISTTIFIMRKAKNNRSNKNITFQNTQIPRLPEKSAGIFVTLMLVAIIIATIYFKLGFSSISGLFVLMAVTASLIVGVKPSQICEDFNESMSIILPGALICGIARGVSLVLEAGSITDTLVFYIANLTVSLPSWLSAIGLLLSQCLFNFVVPSGSGQMLITLPVLISVADLIGMSQQVLVWTSNVADGISNAIFPTSGYFMAILTSAKVPYQHWIKYYFPFFIFTIFVACIGSIIGGLINLGPF